MKERQLGIFLTLELLSNKNLFSYYNAISVF